MREVLYTAIVGKLRICYIKNAYVRLPYTAKKSFFASATLKTLICDAVHVVEKLLRIYLVIQAYA